MVRKSWERTYNTWSSMIQRCTNPKNTNYASYGGKGIEVCEEWKVFKNFLKEMGIRPDGKSLDRVNNSLGYFKENCRWASASTQSHNRNGYSATGEKYIYAERAKSRKGEIYTLYRVSVPSIGRKSSKNFQKAMKIRDELLSK
jgi:hypothetical protein